MGVSNDTLARFVRWMSRGGYKAEALRDGARIFKEVARQLALTPAEYKIRKAPGGDAVAGEVILHADWFYLMAIGESTHGVLLRTCKSQQDYTGGPNQWFPPSDFSSLDKVVQRIQKLKPKESEPAHVC